MCYSQCFDVQHSFVHLVYVYEFVSLMLALVLFENRYSSLNVMCVSVGFGCKT